MNCSNRLRAVVLFPILFVYCRCSRTIADRRNRPLFPTILTAEQLQLIPQLSPVAPSEHPQPRATARRLPKTGLALDPRRNFLSRKQFESWVSTNTNSSTANFPNGKVRTGRNHVNPR